MSNSISKPECSARRDFIKSSVTQTVLSALTLTLACPLAATAGNDSMTNASRVVERLSQALRSIGSSTCMAAADKLEASHKQRDQVYFHLRSADLTAPDVLIIADSLSLLPAEISSTLVSVSLSYNDKLGDDGAITFVRSLPATVGEVGLVGCDIGDSGAEAVLQWANNASKLQMLCIENNRLSDGMKSRFLELGKRKMLMIVV